jgi:DNA repair exonuclease SbcCD ATPase subunit
MRREPPVALLEERAAELEEENAKLRVVEEQFWVLLAEREELEKKVAALSAAASAAATVSTTAGDNNAKKTAMVAGQRQASESLRKENEILSAALQECLELLQTDTRELYSARGPVASFLSWCEIERARAQNAQLAGDFDGKDNGGGAAGLSPARGARKGASSFSPGGADSGANELLTQLQQQHRQLQAEHRQLQEEVDRVDLSRMQALDDVDRLQEHVASLSQHVITMKEALVKERERADQHASNAQQVPLLRARLAEKEGELARANAALETLKRSTDRTGSDLAADAARIRAELQTRRNAGE